MSELEKARRRLIEVMHSAAVLYALMKWYGIKSLHDASQYRIVANEVIDSLGRREKEVEEAAIKFKELGGNLASISPKEFLCPACQKASEGSE